MATNYEFDESQNRVIRSVARPMGVVGSLVLLVSLLGFAGSGLNTYVALKAVGAHNARVDASIAARRARVSGGDPALIAGLEMERQAQQRLIVPPIVAGLLGVVWSLIFLSLGGSLRRASAAFHAVVDTQGNDIDRMMDAVRDLSGAYSIVRILVIYMIAALAIVGIGLATVLR